MKNKNSLSPEKLDSILGQIRSDNVMANTVQNLKLMFSLIDLTSLNTQDNKGKIEGMCQKVNAFSENFPGMENVGAICVYPSMVPVVKKHLSATGVGIASVAAGFPSSQTFPEVKQLESKMAVEAGATEIDIVISVGSYLEGDLEFLESEISSIKKLISPAKLKVILETGLLPSIADIYNASMVSLRAGADFIKTSTGKIQPAASPEAVYVMCLAINDHYLETGKMAGIKPAGGISTADQALDYAGIVRAVLGDKWLNPGLFRIGASRLANQLLGEIKQIESSNPSEINYF
jgi:deoxyribose-phosphate aldolase